MILLNPKWPIKALIAPPHPRLEGHAGGVALHLVFHLIDVVVKAWDRVKSTAEQMDSAGDVIRPRNLPDFMAGVVHLDGCLIS